MSADYADLDALAAAAASTKSELQSLRSLSENQADEIATLQGKLAKIRAAVTASSPDVWPLRYVVLGTRDEGYASSLALGLSVMFVRRSEIAAIAKRGGIGPADTDGVEARIEDEKEVWSLALTGGQQYLVVLDESDVTAFRAWWSAVPAGVIER